MMEFGVDTTTYLSDMPRWVSAHRVRSLTMLVAKISISTEATVRGRKPTCWRLFHKGRTVSSFGGR